MTKLHRILWVGLLLSLWASECVLAQQSAAYRQAVEEAKMRATRNLIEQIYGVWLVSKTEVQDFQTNKDEVIATTAGRLRAVKFSTPAEDRTNNLILIRAAVNREDALDSLKKSGYKGGGSLPAMSEADGEAVYSGPWRNGGTNPPSNRNYVERPLSVAACMAYRLFEHLNLAPPSNVAHWEDVVKEVHHNSQTLVERDLEGRIRLELRLSSEHILYILKLTNSQGVITNSELESASDKVKNWFMKGFVVACYFSGTRCTKVSSGDKSWSAPAFLDINFDVASALTSYIYQHPASDLVNAVGKYSKMTYEYSPSEEKLSILVTLERQEARSALVTLSSAESEQILSQIGKGVKLSVTLYGR